MVTAVHCHVSYALHRQLALLKPPHHSSGGIIAVAEFGGIELPRLAKRAADTATENPWKVIT